MITVGGVAYTVHVLWCCRCCCVEERWLTLCGAPVREAEKGALLSWEREEAATLAGMEAWYSPCSTGSSAVRRRDGLWP